MKNTLLIMVFLIKTQFMLLILLMFLPWARLLLVFFFCKIKLVAIVSPSIVYFLGNFIMGVIFYGVVPSPGKLVACIMFSQ
jgi:hypothetical protein